VNRVGDRYFDQLELTGHADRASDLDLFRQCGLRTLRYPVLWERVAPSGLASADWRWSDERMSRLRELGIEPIVGLVHHGSGPSTTSLIDPGFPEKLAAFAGAVARRYPWVTKFTPVNEPLTTARFSGLYGHWYPHARDDASFVRILLNECRATVLAMAAIRNVTPEAELVQTDDSGRTFSTPLLSYQATFENHRRWLGFDLLTGRVNASHPLFSYLASAGALPEELAVFAERPCPPDVVGLNYYVTSDRFLDERVLRYPRELWGGNRRHRYVDLEAVRARSEGLYGHRAVLLEAWRRYRIPVALTEVHLGCTREEQLRWLVEAWEGALGARRLGADVRAVTVWSLLGATDWDSLVTRHAGHYEPAVWDIRAPAPRPTGLARAVRELNLYGTSSHPVLATRGWWRRPSRKTHSSVGTRPTSIDVARNRARPLLITGATGTLGQALSRVCKERHIEHRLLRRQDMDIADERSVRSALARYRPWAVINAAGYVRVDDAECDLTVCYRENVTGAITAATACNETGVAFATFSSDLVFGGSKRSPYVESDRAEPVCVYGHSKAEAERRVLAAIPRALIVRTSAFFGPWDEHNFLTIALRELRAGRPFSAAADAVVSPTYVPDLASACLDLLIDGEEGIWHLANEGAVTWAEFARMGSALFGLPAELVRDVATAELQLRAIRPLYVALGSERGAIMPPLEDALRRYALARSAGEEAVSPAERVMCG